MLDIRLIREKPDFVKERLATRGGGDEAKIDELLRIDAERRKNETALQQLNAERNKLSKEIGAKRSRAEASDELEARVRQIGEEIVDLTTRTNQYEEQQKNLLLQIPNLPHESVPVGKDASANRVVRSWGEKPKLSGKVLDHVALGDKLKLLDLERAAKLSGSGFICFTGAGAKLERALINFMLDLHTREHGYLEMSPPFLGATRLHDRHNAAAEIRSGHVWTGERRVVSRADRGSAGDESSSRRNSGDCRSSEKFVAYTPCFRREAGSAGRETRGIIRVHQFDKVELVKITTPEKSYDEHETLTADAERVLQLLGLHYRDRRTVHRRSGFRLGQDLRHRSLVAGSGCLSRSFELFELRRFSGAADESALQRCRWKEPVLPHAQRIGSGAAAIVCGAD